VVFITAESDEARNPLLWLYQERLGLMLTADTTLNMKKQFLVLQPPLTDKYRLLVDDISDNETFGTATDIDKIRYNIRMLGDSFNMDLTIKNMFTKEGITGVFPLGRFITILQMKKDETEGRMTFFDFDNDIPFIRPFISSIFSENVFKQWTEIHDLLQSEFSDEDDLFVLFRPDLE